MLSLVVGVFGVSHCGGDVVAKTGFLGRRGSYRDDAPEQQMANHQLRVALESRWNSQ